MADEQMQAWESIVLAEAAVAYAYAVAGPQLPDTERAAAKALYDSHEQARDEALLRLTADGAPAIEIPTFFDLPGDIGTPQQARGLLAGVESRLVANYADLVAALPPPDRELPLDHMLLATNRAMQWGAAAGPWGPQVDQGS